MSGKGTVTSSTGSQEGKVRIVEQGGADGWPALGSIQLLKYDKKAHQSMKEGDLYSLTMHQDDGVPAYFVITPGTAVLNPAQIEIEITDGDSTITLIDRGDYPAQSGSGDWESMRITGTQKIGEIPLYESSAPSASGSNVKCAIIPPSDANDQQVGNWVDFLYY